MSDFFDLEIKGTEKEKIFNFLNEHFSVMGGPMDMICGVLKDHYKTSQKYNFVIFLKI